MFLINVQFQYRIITIITLITVIIPIYSQFRCFQLSIIRTSKVIGLMIFRFESSSFFVSYVFCFTFPFLSFSFLFFASLFFLPSFPSFLWFYLPFFHLLLPSFSFIIWLLPSLPLSLPHILISSFNFIDKTSKRLQSLLRNFNKIVKSFCSNFKLDRSLLLPGGPMFR